MFGVLLGQGNATHLLPSVDDTQGLVSSRKHEADKLSIVVKSSKFPTPINLQVP